MILVGPGLKEARENHAILNMIFEQVSSQQVLILDGGAISLFTASQFDLPEAQLVFTSSKRMGKNCQGLILQARLKTRVEEQYRTFLKGLSL